MNLELIRNYCEKREGGVKGLAREIGMSDTNLFRCIRLNKIQAEDLERVAAALSVKVGVFFGEVDFKDAKTANSATLNAKTIRGNANMTIGGDASVLMSEKVAHLEELLREKERTIQILMEERRQAPPRT